MCTFLFGKVDSLRDLRRDVAIIVCQLVVCCSICGLLLDHCYGLLTRLR